jgi:hypothetical protein
MLEVSPGGRPGGRVLVGGGGAAGSPEGRAKLWPQRPPPPRPTPPPTPAGVIAVIMVFFLVVTLGLEHGLRLARRALARRNKAGLLAALNHLSSELMLLAVASLILTAVTPSLEHVCMRPKWVPGAPGGKGAGREGEEGGWHTRGRAERSLPAAPATQRPRPRSPVLACSSGLFLPPPKPQPQPPHTGTSCGRGWTTSAAAPAALRAPRASASASWRWVGGGGERERGGRGASGRRRGAGARGRVPKATPRLHSTPPHPRPPLNLLLPGPLLAPPEPHVPPRHGRAVRGQGGEDARPGDR